MGGVKLRKWIWPGTKANLRPQGGRSSEGVSLPGDHGARNGEEGEPELRERNLGRGKTLV